MTYQTIDSSIQDGAVVELYEFNQGSSVWRFTNAALDYTWGGFVWAAAPISRDEITQNSEMNQAGITLSFPIDNAFAFQFIADLQEQVTTVTLRRGHVSDVDDEFVVYWKGRVAASSVDEVQINLNCESVFTSLRRPGLRAVYQRLCRHALYRRGCNVDKAAYALATHVNSGSGTALAVQAAAVSPDGWYTGGMIVDSDGGARFILSHIGASLILSRPSTALDATITNSGWNKSWNGNWNGAGVTLYPGCNHDRQTCNDKFGNLPNFGGFPFIPTKNPFGGSSIV